MVKGIRKGNVKSNCIESLGFSNNELVVARTRAFVSEKMANRKKKQWGHLLLPMVPLPVASALANSQERASSMGGGHV